MRKSSFFLCQQETLQSANPLRLALLSTFFRKVQSGRNKIPINSVFLNHQVALQSEIPYFGPDRKKGATDRIILDGTLFRSGPQYGICWLWRDLLVKKYTIYWHFFAPKFYFPKNRLSSACPTVFADSNVTCWQRNKLFVVIFLLLWCIFLNSTSEVTIFARGPDYGDNLIVAFSVS